MCRAASGHCFQTAKSKITALNRCEKETIMPEERFAGAPSFTCLIVTYNSVMEISDLLKDLALHARQAPIILIDNASQDGTPDLIASQFPWVHLICNQENTGYARAVNQGELLCTTPYIFLLNPDIRISDGSVFSKMLACMQRPRTAVTAPLQLQEGSRGCKLNFTWSYSSPQALKLYIANSLNRTLKVVEPIKVSYLNAGCLFLKREAFEHAGKFNEKYFLYGEEPDLFLKLKYWGYDSWLVPAASIIHHRERSLRQVPPFKRLRIRFLAVRNIADALFHGWRLIFLKRLANSPILNRARMNSFNSR
jgi:GT2 family glycosyltransferase